MANLLRIQTFGNQLKAIFDDGTFAMATPTPTGIWLVKNGGTTPPDPGGGDLIDWWTSDYGITGTWEDHSSYSRGGTDWPLEYGHELKAPAAGVIQNYGDVDAAGLKTIIRFVEAYPRKVTASGTLMNGVYVENPTAPAVAMMFQHLDSQLLADGATVAAGQVFAKSGNSAGPGTTGDTHLHAHLLATADVGADRLDFMKFV